eukprot:gene44119-53934_t
MLRVVRQSLAKNGAYRSLSSVAAKGYQPTKLTNTLLLRNLPHTVTQESLAQLAKDINHRKIELQPGCTLHFLSSEEAAKASKVLKEKQKLEVSQVSTALPGVTLENLPPNVTEDMLREFFKDHSVLQVTLEPYYRAQVTLQQPLDLNTLQLPAGVHASVDVAKSPALFVRNIAHLSEQSVRELLAQQAGAGLRRVVFDRPSPDANAQLCVAYFESEEAALRALRQLQG